MFMHCFFLPFCSGKRGVCAFGLPNPPFPLLYVLCVGKAGVALARVGGGERGVGREEEASCVMAR